MQIYERGDRSSRNLRCRLSPTGRLAYIAYTILRLTHHTAPNGLYGVTCDSCRVACLRQEGGLPLSP